MLAIVVPLFVIWQGLTPPSHHFVEQPPSLTNGMVSLGYTGLCLLILAPGLAWRARRALLGLFVVLLVANAALAIWTFYPLRSTLGRHLPPAVLWLYGSLWGALTLTSSIATLAFLGRRVWQALEERDHRAVALAAGLLALAVWPAFMGLHYSSRYTAMSLPYLLLAMEPVRQRTAGTIFAAMVGCAAGAVSLAGYYFQ